MVAYIPRVPLNLLTLANLKANNSTPRRCAAICLWFGAIAGLAERFLYHFFPAPLAPDDLWWAALADVFFFSVLAGLLLVLWIIVPRVRLEALAFFLAAALFLVDCLSIVVSAPGHALLHSVTAVLLATALTSVFLKFRPILLRFGALTSPLLALYLIGYFLLVPLLLRHDESRAGGEAAASAPNVLLIIVDTLAADHLSTYGYPRLTSPKLTALASQGVLFENAVAPSSWTLPSHASMLTGRYASEHHAGQNDWRLDGRFPTVAETFSKRGYRTAGFSANPYFFSRRNGLDRGYDHFEEGTWVQRVFMTNLGRRIQNRLMLARMLRDAVGRCGSETVNRNALRWIVKERKPFFVTINYFDVHEPFMPPPEYLHRFSRLQRPINQFYWPPDIQLAPQQLQDTVDAYDATIAFVDDKIAQFLAQLKTQGVLENTIVLVTSDHGETFQQHGFMFHNKGLYWDLIHVPLLIYGPRWVPSGVRISRPISLQSLPSTLLELAGLQAQADFDSPSLAALWKDPAAQTAWPYPVSELAGSGESPRFPSYYGPMRSVVTPEWHFIEGGRLGKELYSCCSPELENLASTAQGERVSAAFLKSLDDEDGLTVTPKALTAQLNSGKQALEVIELKHPVNEDDRKKINDLLHALGYVR
jgi:arylsulfatase A-like enzyme